ncbi:hypothetical protein OG204_06665 [Streptomyces sp. NBC_01387]|uniref:hypothetical protein n=1 Tax=unclassified Streptomyces TaxID=2593676 RepID=UPI0020242AEB|nr:MULTISPECIES: hypothetical protein [unclassified Streptomyces]MCX4552030.1 hypothetical protein [Streptomyces sp. NBC_01500]WSC23379.1 hypothetical protein OIE60_28955 [Streptomyces sp. NBC_01766]WSV57290.1 hypothetical protein OG282_28380 [Streptomyces sp. NBC_01014]
MPPLLGRSRRRGGPLADPALDDVELSEVRTQLAQGRWVRVSSLLAATADDWDRRGHRLVVLAEGSGSAAWARDWLLAEPESADAATLLACATVLRALRGKDPEDQAREACRAAARMAPSDPTPWLGLLILARSRGTEEEVSRLFDEVRSRHPEHHHAHHLMAARLAERHPDAGQDPLHEVYDFAAWAAEQAPADSPLAVLPVVAHAERYRVLATAGSEPDDPALSTHWTGRRARQVMKAAFDWWLEWEREDHPRNRIDLNFLAHAKFCEGRPAEAAALFHRIGEHVTAAPWSYPDRDPYRAFKAARGAALGTV